MDSIGTHSGLSVTDCTVEAFGCLAQISSRFLWIPILLRLAFLPLFARCNVQPRSVDSTVVFNSDVYPIVFMVLMALSNGYLSTLAMMAGPRYMSRLFLCFCFDLRLDPVQSGVES